MIKVATAKLKSGMVTAKPIKSKHGQEIAPANTTLSTQIIARLSFYKINDVFVTRDSYNRCNASSPLPSQPAAAKEVEEVKEVPVVKEEIPQKESETVQEASESSIHYYSQRLQASPGFQAFQTSYSRNIVNLMQNFQELINGNSSVDLFHDLLEEASDMFASKTSLEIFDMIHNIRSVDDTVYAHSLNVALISRAIGKWLHYSLEDLDALTLAGLLHDIGKTQIADEVLNKQGSLTDEELELIRSHAKAGYSILKPIRLDTRVKLAALQHHERYDGSGYPRGLQGDEIDDFASIIAIADVYDAMTAARSYRAPLCAFQVISAFEQDGFQKYNPNFIFTFLKRVAHCYNNSRVLLSDGVSGSVIFLNENKLSRPIVKTDQGIMIDLSDPQNKDLFIKSIL